MKMRPMVIILPPRSFRVKSQWTPGRGGGLGLYQPAGVDPPSKEVPSKRAHRALVSYPQPVLPLPYPEYSTSDNTPHVLAPILPVSSLTTQPPTHPSSIFRTDEEMGPQLS